MKNNLPGSTGYPLESGQLIHAVENGYPTFAAPDNRFNIAAGGQEFQTIIIPGVSGQNFVVSDVVAFGSVNGRVNIELSDIGKAFTHQPVDWRVFEKIGYPIIPNFLELASGSHVQVTFFNDDAAATGDFTIALVGVLY